MLIESIGTHVGSCSVSNTVRQNRFGLKETFLQDKIGVSSTARAEEGEGVVGLSKKAIDNLKERSGIDLDKIEILILCTQNPDNYGLPHNSAILHGILNLNRKCVCFDISLGCSGYVYGLSIIQSMMRNLNLKVGLLVTCDPYSKIIDEEDRNTSLLFGDGATATLLSENGSWQPGYYDLGTYGVSSSAIQTDTETGKFSMNGRKVYEFAVNEVPESIDRVIELNRLAKDDVDLYILHQGSRFIVNQISNKMNIDRSKMPFDCEEYGNTVSSSIPMILSDHLDREGTILLSGFGVGLSWGSVPLFRV